MDHQWDGLVVSIVQALIAGYGEALITVDSADFDGTNDWLTRGADLTGAADSKSGIVSMWLRIDGGDGGSAHLLVNHTVLGGGSGFLRFFVQRVTTNIFRVTGANAAGTTILRLDTVATYTAGATWLHLLISWDLATSAEHLYVNDVLDLSVVTSTNDSIDHTVADFAIGAQADGTVKFDGCLAEVYFAPGQYLDFSVITNRRKFISSGGKPVYLGADGSTPTGTAPIVYQHLDDAEAAANFAVNAGSGGGFTVNGTLATGSTSPSD